MFRKFAVALLVLVLAASQAGPASAGGWALAELKNSPDQVVAGQPFTVEILLLQHGKTPMTGQTDVRLTFVNRDTASETTVTGTESTTESGVYQFVPKLSFAGEYKWRVSHGALGGFTTFPTLHVSGTSETGTPDLVQKPEIVMSAMVYLPTHLTVSAGTTVTWTNADQVPHQVSSPGAIDFDDSGLILPGETYQFTFNAPGSYEILCGPHPGMVGVITVV